MRPPAGSSHTPIRTSALYPARAAIKFVCIADSDLRMSEIPLTAPNRRLSWRCPQMPAVDGISLLAVEFAEGTDLRPWA